MTGSRVTRAALLAGLALLVAGALARAADETPSFKNRTGEEKRWVARVGEAIVKAAHGTGKNIGLVKYDITKPKANRTELAIKMEYFGKVSNKRYLADIVVKVDSTDKDSWEVLDIDYTDNNNIPANLKKLQALKKQFNK